MGRCRHSRDTFGPLEFDESPHLPPVTDRPEETVVDRLCEVFGIPASGDQLVRLVTSDQLSGKVVVLCDWDSTDLGTRTSRFTALLKEHVRQARHRNGRRRCA